MANKRRFRESAGLNSEFLARSELQILFQVRATPVFEGKGRDNQDWNTDEVIVKHG